MMMMMMILMMMMIIIIIIITVLIQRAHLAQQTDQSSMRHRVKHNDKLELQLLKVPRCTVDIDENTEHNSWCLRNSNR